MFEVKLQVADEENFKEFGTIISKDGKGGEKTSFFDWYGGIAFGRFGNEASFGMVCPKYNPTFTLTEFERHSYTQEALIPLFSDIIVVVGREEAFGENADSVNKEAFSAFLVRHGSAVILNTNIWHKAPVTFAEQTDVLVLFQKGSSENDCTSVSLESHCESLRILL